MAYHYGEPHIGEPAYPPAVTTYQTTTRPAVSTYQPPPPAVTTTSYNTPAVTTYKTSPYVEPNYAIKPIPPKSYEGPYEVVDPYHSRHSYNGHANDFDPRDYRGTVLSVEYVTHEAGWQPRGGAPYSPSHAQVQYPTVDTHHDTYSRYDPYPQGSALTVPRSYPPRHYEVDRYDRYDQFDRYDRNDRYGAPSRYAPPPRYEPPPPPPRYTPPPPPPRYEPPPPQQSYQPYQPPPQPYQPPPQPYQPPQPYPPAPATVPPPSNPNVRPWMGVALKWLDDLDQGGRNNVAVVHQVIPDSPAWKAGIQVDDQLEYWENVKLDSEEVWKSKINSMRVGDVVDIGIHRNHRDQRVRVVIEGTDKAQGPKKIIPSSNAVHTDN